MNTDELIHSLAEDTQGKRPSLPSPLSMWSISLGLSLVYCMGLVALFGMRSDLAEFMMMPLAFIEIWLMLVLLASSLWCAVCLVYPDQGGRPMLPKAPYMVFALLIGLILIQISEFNMNHFMAEMDAHMMCFSCLVGSTFIPALLLFIITQKGATTEPIKSGAYIVLASVSIGALALRLHEPTNDMAHIIMSHYLPMLLLAALGAALGRFILKW